MAEGKSKLLDLIAQMQKLVHEMMFLSESSHRLNRRIQEAIGTERELLIQERNQHQAGLASLIDQHGTLMKEMSEELEQESKNWTSASRER